MRKPLILTAFIVISLVYYADPVMKHASTFAHSQITGLPVLAPDGKELWIEVHDVSPGYAEKLDEVLNILEAHPEAYSKAVLFVIPNHGGDAPLHAYPEFVNTLKALDARGYVIGLHGYTHSRPMSRPEFKTTREQAAWLLQRGETEFHASGLRPPSHFLPPGWQTSVEVDSMLRERFEYIYYYYFIVSPEGIIPSRSLEYVWHGYSYRALDRARKDYATLNGVIRLTIHLGAINTPEGLEFLDSYLGWIEEKSNISGA
jgi:hypothetical protein